MPSQALAYKIGQLKLPKVRDKSGAALRSRSTLKGFRSAVLGNGGVPLTVMERLVDECIRTILSE